MQRAGGYYQGEEGAAAPRRRRGQPPQDPAGRRDCGPGGGEWTAAPVGCLLVERSVSELSALRAACCVTFGALQCCLFQRLVASAAPAALTPHKLCIGIPVRPLTGLCNTLLNQLFAGAQGADWQEAERAAQQLGQPAAGPGRHHLHRRRLQHLPAHR